MQTPKSIKSSQEQIQILWADQHASEYIPRELRLACRCAACVDEWTHETLINPATVPVNVKANRIEAVGNYALQFSWSDLHSSGLYTYDYLRSLCACTACRSVREFQV